MNLSLALWWLSFNLLSIVVLAFYSMLEMACVSFNKVRLQYYVSKGIKQAIWLNYLLQNPSRLFGTTLIGVNVAMFAGSECSREFHIALGINPDFAPLSQVFIVIVFGELAPMFAARRFAEHVAMLGVPLIYLSAKLMTPLLWCLGIISKACNMIIGGRESQANIFLTQEELQKILEEQDEQKVFANKNEELNAVSTNIFNLSTKDASQVMESLQNIPLLPSNATVKDMRELLAKTPLDFLPIYHQEITNIVGIIFPRDVIRIPEKRKVRDYARPPWFITQATKVTQLLQQFRSNNERVAVILDSNGHAVGLVNLDDIMEEIFGTSVRPTTRAPMKRGQKQLFIERTFPGDMLVGDFNTLFGVSLNPQEHLTFAELLTLELGHPPELGESIFIPPFEIKVEEMRLLEVKTVSIHTKLK